MGAAAVRPMPARFAKLSGTGAHPLRVFASSRKPTQRRQRHAESSPIDCRCQGAAVGLGWRRLHPHRRKNGRSGDSAATVINADGGPCTAPGRARERAGDAAQRRVLHVLQHFEDAADRSLRQAVVDADRDDSIGPAVYQGSGLELQFDVRIRLHEPAQGRDHPHPDQRQAPARAAGGRRPADGATAVRRDAVVRRPIQQRTRSAKSMRWFESQACAGAWLTSHQRSSPMRTAVASSTAPLRGKSPCIWAAAG